MPAGAAAAGGAGGPASLHAPDLAAKPADDALFQPRDVALGNAQAVGDLLLGALDAVVEPEAQFHDAALAAAQAVEGLAQQAAVDPGLDVPVDAVAVGTRQHVAEQQLVAVPIHVEGFVQGNLGPGAAALPQVHQDLVLDALG